MTSGRAWDEGKNVRLVERMRSVPLPILVAGETQHQGAASPCAAPETSNSGAQRDGCLRFLGRLTQGEIERLMRESSIYLVTSRYEPFGLAAVEAALAGCAVVASDLPSQREVWGDAAVFFRSDDADALERLLRELAGDPERVRAVARRCRTRALGQLRADTMVSRYAALYEELKQRRQHTDSRAPGRGTPRVA